MLTSVNTITSPVRAIVSKVELYSGSTLVDTFSYNDNLKSAEVERVGEDSKFFGFGVCQKVNIKLIDKERLINLTTDNYFKVYFRSTEAEYVNNYPKFYITEVNRDENTNELSITAYDSIKKADTHTVAEVELTSYTVQEFAEAISLLMGFNGLIIKGLIEGETCFNTSYAEGANFEGTETLRAALNAIAEITQTIYYLDGGDNLVFKRLSSGNADLTIDRSQYITLDSSTNRRLAAITHATELGDNVTAAMDITGTTQYIRNNPFWELREDIATLLDNAIAAVGALTINQFNCNWRGNYLLEVGDKIDLVTKDNNTVSSYVLNDVVSYSGAFSEVTQWSYTDNDSETDSNPTTLGEAIAQTIAKVDKANKDITLLASDITANKENISNLEINTEAITGKVSSIEETTTAALEGLNDDIATLTQSVEAKITDEEVTIKISEALSNGIDKVETSTGFTFNEDGLTVSKSDSEMKTAITEDGMTVYKNDEAVLTADNTGVNAQNLHATTYLIIGNNSRFEDYGGSRTGCFWIGG